jgi:hypothetical protein
LADLGVVRATDKNYGLRAAGAKRMLHLRIDVPPVPEALEAVAEGLVLLNVWYLSHASDNGIELPELYGSGIVYRREPHGREWWESAADILGVVEDRSGDCEDLAAFRAAELRVYEDEDASVRVVRTSRGTFHAVVLRANGSIEDPSRKLVQLERARKAKR